MDGRVSWLGTKTNSKYKECVVFYGGILISRLKVQVLSGAPANSKLVSSTFRFQFSHLLSPGFK